jgi:hypothetical protein
MKSFIIALIIFAIIGGGLYLFGRTTNKPSITQVKKDTTENILAQTVDTQYNSSILVYVPCNTCKTGTMGIVRKVTIRVTREFILQDTSKATVSPIASTDTVK